MFSLVLTAVALGLSNFAAAIGIGLAGVDAQVRIRVAVVFGGFEALMPLLGLALGHAVAGSLSGKGRYVGGGLLIATGGYGAWQAWRARSHEAKPTRHVGPLLVTAAALSIDNLIVGFALGTYKTPLLLTAIVIAVVSVSLSLLGLEVGDHLGDAVERWSGELGGGVLILVGLAIACGLL